jgi:predicted transcriptional regulator
MAQQCRYELLIQYRAVTRAARTSGRVASVVLASLCGRRITASEIAREIEMPRSTVLRRLQELTDMGFVRRDGRGYLATEKANVRAFKRDLDTIVAEIIAAAKELEKISVQF